MAKDQYDQIREAEFREIARRIVSKDRDSKKYRFSVDTAGEILKALEKAYQQGKNEQKLKKSFVMPIKRKDAVYWGCIPPCPRRAFYALCSHLLDYRPNLNYNLIPVSNGINIKWALLTNGKELDEHYVRGLKSINPLIKLGLLEYLNDNKDALIISQKGKETWLEAKEENTIEQFLY